MDRKFTPLRLTLGLVLLAVVIPPVVVGMSATGMPFVAAAILSTLAGIAGWFALTPYLPARLPRANATWRTLLALWVALGLFGAYRVAHLGVFMSDVTLSEYAYNPPIRPLDNEQWAKPFFPTHNCFTCYIVAAHLAGEGVDNLYDRKYYRRAEEPTPIHEQVGTALHVDTYQYPPPFLLLPRLLLAGGGNFYQLRAYWFALNILVCVTTCVVLAIWLGGRAFHAYWFVLPIFLAASTTMGALQIQNVHLVIVMIALLALPAFHTQRHWLGGALLGFAVVSKLFPGVLCVYLLLQRRWRALTWTVGWMIVYCAATVAIFGPKPFQAFVEFQQPKLQSGEAFDFATTAITALIKNDSIMGVAYKLEKLGVLSNPASLAHAAMWGYSALLLMVIGWVGLRSRSGWAMNHVEQDDNSRRLALARLWMGLIILGQLRSPFLPWTYGNPPVMLLLALLIPGVWRTGRLAMLLVAWSLLAVALPLPFGSLTTTPDLVHTLLALAAVLIACGAAVVPRPPAPPLDQFTTPATG